MYSFQVGPQFEMPFSGLIGMIDCNYFIDNGLAYTEDRIVVHNIFIYKITRKVDITEAKNYFEKFGEVTRFRILNKKTVGRRGGFRIGFVHFKEARAAAEVLKFQCHKISSSKLVWVKACDSWHQPQGDKVGGKMNKEDAEIAEYVTEGVNNEVEKTGTIYDLNDDCLFIIFKAMHLPDQINFACSHPRFAAVFKCYAKLYHKTVQANDLESLSLWNIRQFLMLAGQFIETFTGAVDHRCRDRVINFLKEHCPNIRNLNLDATRMKLSNLRKLLTNKPKLISLSLINSDIDDHTMYAISKLTQLESLVVSQSSQLTGQYLNCLTNLRKLRLFSCFCLQSSHLIEALSAMPNLCFLDLRGSEELNKKVFEKLLLCNNLEVLQMSCTEVPYEIVAKIPKLKSLSLFSLFPTEIRVELLSQLVKEKSKQLEFLQILPNCHVRSADCEYISKLEGLKKLHFSYGLSLTDHCLGPLTQLKELEEFKISGCKSITNTGLLQIVVHCEKLKWVNIQNTNIDNDFANKVITFLRKNKRPHGRITFLVAGSKMNEFSLPKDYESNDIKSLVHFEFDMPNIIPSYANLYDAFESSDLDMDVPFFDIFESEGDDDLDFDDLIGINPFHYFDDLHPDLHGDDADILFFD